MSDDKYEALAAAAEQGELAPLPNSRPNERHKTYDELLVEALDKIGADALREHFAPAEVPSGSLLQGRKRAGVRAATVQRQIRLDSGQIAALDALAMEVGAKDRTTLINGAYRLAYLGS